MTSRRSNIAWKKRENIPSLRIALDGIEPSNGSNGPAGPAGLMLSRIDKCSIVRSRVSHRLL